MQENLQSLYNSGEVQQTDLVVSATVAPTFWEMQGDEGWAVKPCVIVLNDSEFKFFNFHDNSKIVIPLEDVKKGSVVGGIPLNITTEFGMRTEEFVYVKIVTLAKEKHKFLISAGLMGEIAKLKAKLKECKLIAKAKKKTAKKG